MGRRAGGAAWGALGGGARGRGEPCTGAIGDAESDAAVPRAEPALGRAGVSRQRTRAVEPAACGDQSRPARCLRSISSHCRGSGPSLAP